MQSPLDSQIALVVAMGLDGSIGYQNKLLWHLPDDLKFFKQLTMGHALIMGRLTFESIGRSLPGRQTLVLSQKGLDAPDGVLVCASLQEALSKVESGRKPFVVGGAQIYRLALPQAQTLFITRVETKFADADAHFPELKPAGFEKADEQHHPADDRHAWPFAFERWERISG